MDTLDLMIEIKKREPSAGLSIGIHDAGFGTITFGIGTDQGYSFRHVKQPEDIKKVLEDRLEALNNRGPLFKRF